MYVCIYIYIQQKFPFLNEAKTKEAIFVGSQGRILTKHKTLEYILNEV
jgi:hypothetical protein